MASGKICLTATEKCTSQNTSYISAKQMIKHLMFDETDDSPDPEITGKR